MRSVMRMRHYCDFCKKSGGSAPAMRKHEAGCTANPGRSCRMCQFAGFAQKTMPELQDAYAKGFEALREACDGCPACIFSAQRQYWSSVDETADHSDNPRNRVEGWEFRSACKAFFEEHQSERYY